MASLALVIGGIGFFLLGMHLMADGLKSIAGDSLRRLLNRFTGGTISAITTGAIITILVQSSSATTFMTIGFVSAGMLTFLQATGVIFGANLGTTSIGWIVAGIGLKFSISQLALPIIGFGVLLKTFLKGKMAHLGLALAGFGLIFVGIQFLQDGMADLNNYIDFSQFTGDSMLDRLLLIIIGFVMTVIMQSSGASVATIITVLSMGVIDLDQAIALVIGSHIGTTLTAIIAAIGASTPAKRTALAHIMFNVLTGTIVYFLLTPIVAGTVWATGLLNWTDPALVLAFFNTFFPLFGILIFGPFIKQFVALMSWMLPEKKSRITQHLDDSIIPIPAVAVETAMRALKEATELTLTETAGKFEAIVLGGSSKSTVESHDEKLLMIHNELDEIRQFVTAIQADSSESRRGYISLLHILDHIDRMNRLVRLEMNNLQLTNSADKLHPIVTRLQDNLKLSIEAIQQTSIPKVLPSVSAFSQELAAFRRQERATTFDVTAKGEVPAAEAHQYVQLILVVDTLAYHLWRAMYHLSGGTETQDATPVLASQVAQSTARLS